STISGEGKTFFAMNLAGILAFSDKKVIVIDLDMRKPKIHLGFNTENVKGVSTILSGIDQGQLEGPISFGFNVLDQNERPILFDDTVRPFMLDFMARRLNVQLARLQKRNPRAFMFVDEPGLQFLFSAMAGYSDLKAKGDLDQFFAQVDRPRGIHLCGNPDWDFLLNLDLDVLSLDVYTNAEIFASYAKSITRFLDRGGVIVWGIVPTGFEAFDQEEIPTLIGRLETIWKTLWARGVDRQQLLSQAMLSPATCCLVNPDKERTVERAFAAVKRMAVLLREKYLR
ncbi:MAG: hypothetical protein R6W95_17635, partial [Desulfosarcina sp.]